MKVMAHTQLFQSSAEKTCYPHSFISLIKNGFAGGPLPLNSSFAHCRGNCEWAGLPCTASALPGHALGGQKETQPPHGTHHSADVDGAAPQGVVCGWVNLEVQALI